MPPHPFLSRGAALALLPAAGLGAAALGLGAGPLPAWTAAPEGAAWMGLASAAALAARLLWRRGHQAAGHQAAGYQAAGHQAAWLGALGLSLDPRMQGMNPEHVLRFEPAAPVSWAARQGAWCLQLARTGAGDMPWRLDLSHAGTAKEAAESLPLVCAATLDAVLTLARRLGQPGAGGWACDSASPAGALLERDLEFPLPHQPGRVTALAEGGYALHDAAGCSAISAETADRLLAEALPVGG